MAQRLFLPVILIAALLLALAMASGVGIDSDGTCKFLCPACGEPLFHPGDCRPDKSAPTGGKP